MDITLVDAAGSPSAVYTNGGTPSTSTLTITYDEGVTTVSEFIAAVNAVTFPFVAEHVDTGGNPLIHRAESDEDIAASPVTTTAVGLSAPLGLLLFLLLLSLHHQVLFSGGQRFEPRRGEQGLGT